MLAGQDHVEGAVLGRTPPEGRLGPFLCTLPSPSPRLACRSGSSQ